jgi:hypothetical protein
MSSEPIIKMKNSHTRLYALKYVSDTISSLSSHEEFVYMRIPEPWVGDEEIGKSLDSSGIR